MRSKIIQNLDKLNKRLTTADFMQRPSGAFLRNWKEDFREEAIDRAPKWHGDILRAIQTAQDTKRWPLWARVFSEAPQARWAEYGTGLLSEDPKSAKTRYFPPAERLRDWSMDHGLDPYVVALGIFNRGGTPPTHFFSDAERAADSRMNERLIRFGRAIEYEAGRNV